MLILLSPAKSLDYKSLVVWQNFTIPYFVKETKKLAAEMKKFSVSDLEKLMGVSKNLAELNRERFKKFSDEFNLQNACQALLAFDGDVYKPIEAKKFSATDFEFAQKNLRILSGFYGLLRPLDLMQPYRLEMGTDFKKTIFEKDLGVKNLYQFWGNKISQHLDLECKNNGSKHIINLASEEYFSAINPQKISAKIINVVFKENKNGIYKIVGIHAKKARGLMTNFIVQKRISNPEDLKNFTIEKYCFTKEMSNESNFIFVR